MSRGVQVPYSPEANIGTLRFVVMADVAQDRKQAEVAQRRLDTAELKDLVIWFETELCGKSIRDPRHNEVVFGLQHFAYLIKLRDKITGRKVNKPKRKAEAIKTGALTREHFGPIDEDRAQTLSWLRAIVERPTVISHNRQKHVPGDEVFTKEFENKKASGYRYKSVVFRKVSNKTLEPVTSYRKKRLNVKQCDVIWPPGFDCKK